MTLHQLDPAKTTIVAGCPGAGKTTRLLSMIDDRLRAGVAPNRIGFFTFTRGAQREAVTRAMDKFGLEEDALPYFQTIHSLGFRQMGLKSSQVLGRAHLDALATYLNVGLSGVQAIEGGTESSRLGDRLMHHENLARVRCVPLRKHYEESHEDFSYADLERFAEGLRRFKDDNDLLDFTDMLSLFVEAGEAPIIDCLFVDEAQDLSHLQWSAVAKCAREASEVIVAGDDDQAIFEWAGADVAAFVDLGGNVEKLEQSWRVPPEVQHFAAQIVDRIRHRRDKRWRARDAVGAVYYHLDFDSVIDHAESSLALGEWLVLARNKQFLRRAETVLRSAGLPYTVHGVPSVPHLPAIRAWENLRNGRAVGRDEILSCYDAMSRNVGYGHGAKALISSQDDDWSATIDELRDEFKLLTDAVWYEALDRIPLGDRGYVRACLARNEDLSSIRIRLSTIHAAKGGEADNVVLMLDQSYLTHRASRANPDAECRVFYVGATRSRKTLHVIQPRRGRGFEI